MATTTATRTHGGVLYYVVKVPREQQQNSVESGWENPFRPGGELSKEADEIVELIKGGKPITPTPGSNPPLPTLDQTDYNNIQTPKKAADLNAAAPNKSANGNVKNDKPTGGAASTPGALDVQRGTVKQGDASQVEHVTIKKKPKCKCCVLQ